MYDLGYTHDLNFVNGSLAFWDEHHDVNLYNFVDLKVHSPSEHTFDGDNYDLEI
jgi:hypothetical protein